MDDPNAQDAVDRLSHDEALVLFDWLGRKGVLDSLRPPVTGEAEFIAICALLCVLEATVDEVFSPDYLKLVEAARQRLLPIED